MYERSGFSFVTPEHAKEIKPALRTESGLVRPVSPGEVHRVTVACDAMQVPDPDDEGARAKLLEWASECEVREGQRWNGGASYDDDGEYIAGNKLYAGAYETVSVVWCDDEPIADTGDWLLKIGSGEYCAVLTDAEMRALSRVVPPLKKKEEA